MAYFSDVVYLAPTGSTATHTHTAVNVPPQLESFAAQIIVEAAGATPTCDFTVQGSLDGTTFFAIPYVTDASDTVATTAITSTSVGTKVIFFNTNAEDRFYKLFRVVTANNTNVTYRVELYGKTDD